MFFLCLNVRTNYGLSDVIKNKLTTMYLFGSPEIYKCDEYGTWTRIKNRYGDNVPLLSPEELLLRVISAIVE